MKTWMILLENIIAQLKYAVPQLTHSKNAGQVGFNKILRGLSVSVQTQSDP